MEGSTEHDPQMALKTFKTKTIEVCRNHQRTNRPKLENAIKSLQKELENKADSPDLTEDEILEQSKMIAEQIKALKKKRRESMRLLCSARNKLEGETMSKHWVKSAKESIPHNTIRALRNPLQNPTQRETRSDRMAEMAKEYHEKLLSID